MSAKKKRWACKDFKASEDPSFCANCGDFASSHKGPTPGAPRSFRLSVPLKADPLDKLCDGLAEKFLRWPLPDSVCADACASTQGPGRVGTNLLSYVEARQMMRDIVLPELRKLRTTP